MIWTGFRQESYIYRRVTWPGLVEAEDYGMFTGGRLTHSALSQLRSQGTLDFSGSAIPDEHDLVRSKRANHGGGQDQRRRERRPGKPFRRCACAAVQWHVSICAR